MTVHIMVGVSGSGKSTLAKRILSIRGGFCFSADNEMIEADGVYRFKLEKLAEAHRTCLREFARCLVGVNDPGVNIVVDNTNSTVMEASPYIALGLALGHHIAVHHVHAEPAVAHARNLHEVPLLTIERMAARIEAEWPGALPWHWQPENEPRITLIAGER